MSLLEVNSAFTVMKLYFCSRGISAHVTSLDFQPFQSVFCLFTTGIKMYFSPFQQNDDEAERQLRRSNALVTPDSSATDNANLQMYLQMYTDNVSMMEAGMKLMVFPFRNSTKTTLGT